MSERVLLWAVKGGIFSLLLTPLVIVGVTVFPTLFPKAIYFRIGVEIVFLLYLLLLLRNRSYLPKLSPLFLAVLFCIEILALSTWKGINPERSFFGTIERMEGFILFLHLFLFFVVLVGVFRQKKDWIHLLRFAALVSIPLGLAAISQKLGIFYFFSDPAEYRVSSTVGNPIFYASYLLFAIFLSLFLGMAEKNRRWKILFLVLAACNFFLLLLTATRGAWIGATVGGLLLIFFWFFFIRSGQAYERRYAVLFGILLILFFFFLFLLFSKLGYVPRTNFLDRYESLWSTVVEFKNPRILVWKLGLEAWKDTPLFGYGPESFSYIYDTYYQAHFLKAIPESVFFDRAHNKVIDVLVTSGIIGLVSYLSVFGVAFFVLWKYGKERFGRFCPLLILALLVSYFTQNLFALDTVTTYMMFFFVLAFIDANFYPSLRVSPLRQEAAGSAISPSTSFEFQMRWGKIGAAILACLATVFIIFTFNIRPLAANMQLAQAHELFGAGKPERALASLEQGVSRAPSYLKFETSYYATETLFFALPQPSSQGLEKEFSQELQNIIVSMEASLEKKPEFLHMRSYLLLAQAYQMLASIESNTSFWEDEERILGKAIRLNPEFPNVYWLAGKMRFLQHRQEEGMVFYSKAYELDNNFSKFYEWLGLSYVETGEKRKGANALRESLKLGEFYAKEEKFRLPTVWMIGGLYEEVGDLKTMAEFYEEVISRAPGAKPHPQLYASLSTVYAMIGDKKKARETTLKMVELYPELRGKAEEFLSTLNKGSK